MQNPIKSTDVCVNGLYPGVTAILNQEDTDYVFIIVGITSMQVSPDKDLILTLFNGKNHTINTSDANYLGLNLINMSVDNLVDEIEYHLLSDKNVQVVNGIDPI